MTFHKTLTRAHLHLFRKLLHLSATLCLPERKNIPVIIGGPGFNNKRITQEWLKLDGVNAIVGSEVDAYLADLIKDYFNRKDIRQYPGVFTKESIDADTTYIFREWIRFRCQTYRLSLG